MVNGDNGDDVKNTNKQNEAKKTANVIFFQQLFFVGMVQCI